MWRFERREWVWKTIFLEVLGPVPLFKDLVNNEADEGALSLLLSLPFFFFKKKSKAPWGAFPALWLTDTEAQLCPLPGARVTELQHSTFSAFSALWYCRNVSWAGLSGVAVTSATLEKSAQHCVEDIVMIRWEVGAAELIMSSPAVGTHTCLVTWG